MPLIREEGGAAAPARALEQRLQHAAQFVAGLAAPDGDREAVDQIKRFLETRTELVGSFRVEGLAATQARMLDPTYLAHAQATRGIERDHPDCGREISSHALRSVSADGPQRRSETVEPNPATPGPISRATTARQRLGIGYPIAIVLVLALISAVLLLLARLDNRRDTRYACNIPCQIRVNGVLQYVRIKDIGRRGAKLQADNHLSPGDRGELLLSDGPHQVRVAWANPHSSASISGAGCRFRHGNSRTEHPEHFTTVSDSAGNHSVMETVTPCLRRHAAARPRHRQAT